MPLYPRDLDGKSADEIAEMLFGEKISPSWQLERSTGKQLLWKDKRLGVSWPVSHGYLIGLNEVSTRDHAREFAQRNKITLLNEGGYYCKGVAEFVCSCSSVPPVEELDESRDVYTIRIKGVREKDDGKSKGADVDESHSEFNDVLVSVGYGTLLFRRLVHTPAAEDDDRIPDAASITTVVLQGVEKDDVCDIAELALFHLRRQFRGVNFRLWPMDRLHECPDMDSEEDDLDIRDVDSGLLPSARNAQAIAFFNRAQESDPITAFLYYYRVVEACFDEVLSSKISQVRSDAKVTELELLKFFRKLQRNEDRTSLRLVLTQLIKQAEMEEWKDRGLLLEPNLENLVETIYKRRNSIAHGRKGSHEEVLVPYSFTMKEMVSEREWVDVMKSLAEVALEKWILC